MCRVCAIWKSSYADSLIDALGVCVCVGCVGCVECIGCVGCVECVGCVPFGNLHVPIR